MGAGAPNRFGVVVEVGAAPAAPPVAPVDEGVPPNKLGVVVVVVPAVPVAPVAVAPAAGVSGFFPNRLPPPNRPPPAAGAAAVAGVVPLAVDVDVVEELPKRDGADVDVVLPVVALGCPNKLGVAGFDAFWSAGLG